MGSVFVPTAATFYDDVDVVAQRMALGEPVMVDYTLLSAELKQEFVRQVDAAKAGFEQHQLGRT